MIYTQQRGCDPDSFQADFHIDELNLYKNATTLAPKAVPKLSAIIILLQTHLTAQWVYKDQSKLKNVESLMEIEDVTPDRYKKILENKDLHEKHNLILRTMIKCLDGFPYRIIHSTLGLGGNHVDLWQCGCMRTYQILYMPGGRFGHDEKCAPCTLHRELLVDLIPADTSPKNEKGWIIADPSFHRCVAKNSPKPEKYPRQETIDRFLGDSRASFHQKEHGLGCKDAIPSGGFEYQEMKDWQSLRGMVTRSSKGQALTAQELSVKRILEYLGLPFEEKFLLESPVERRFYVIDFHIAIPSSNTAGWLLECTWTSRKYPSACAGWLRKRAILFNHKFWRAKQQSPFVTVALLEAQWLLPQEIRAALSPLQYTDLVFCSLDELYFSLARQLTSVRTSKPSVRPLKNSPRPDNIERNQLILGKNNEFDP